MGNSLNKVDEGLFICGVEGLEDMDRLDRLGIKCVLNAASMELYKMQSIEHLSTRFEVEALEAADSEECNLSLHFDKVIDFIEAGRQKGGVVVHCAAGISRASTSVCAYLMAKESLDLSSAFAKVLACRNIVNPNAGFWRQLRDFEAALSARGQRLVSQMPSEVPVQPDGEQPQLDLDEFAQKLKRLDVLATSKAPYATHFLTAKLRPAAESSPEGLCEQLRSSTAMAGCVPCYVVAPGVRLEQAVIADGGVSARLRCVPSIDATSLQALLEAQAGIEAAACEAG